MHGPTCIFWANLTPFSLQGKSYTRQQFIAAYGGATEWDAAGMANAPDRRGQGKMCPKCGTVARSNRSASCRTPRCGHVFIPRGVGSGAEGGGGELGPAAASAAAGAEDGWLQQEAGPDKDEYDDLPDPIIIGGQVGRMVSAFLIVAWSVRRAP